MRWILLTLIIASLAGCAGDAPVDPCVAEPDAADCGPVVGAEEIDDGTGAIRGAVVDAAITPIEGAKVALTGQEADVLTDATGGFVFLDLEPGAYFLKVSKPGWRSTQTSVTVEAGVVPPVTRVLMEEAPGTEPLSLFAKFDGYIGCAATMWVLLPNMCEAAGDPDQYEILTYGTTQIPDLFQVEVLWDQTQETGRDLSFIAYVTEEDGSGSQRVGNVWGPSPLICTITPTAVCDNGDGTGGGGAGLNETGFPGGFYAYLGPGCYQGCVPGTAVGPGVVVQQKYQLFGSAFFNHTPPEGWTLVYDGEYKG